MSMNSSIVVAAVVQWPTEDPVSRWPRVLSEQGSSHHVLQLLLANESLTQWQCFELQSQTFTEGTERLTVPSAQIS